jgi:hypothetical protein
MPALKLAHYVPHIPRIRFCPALEQLVREVDPRYQGDEATPRLNALLAANVERLVRAIYAATRPDLGQLLTEVEGIGTFGYRAEPPDALGASNTLHNRGLAP